LKESSPSKPAIKAEETVAKRDEVEQLPAAIVTAERKATSDAAKLVRKRRVQPPEAEIRVKRKGASGIQDIFGGPNP